MRAASLGALALAALLATALPARAGLFDDEEARKAIVDLRTRIKDVDDAAKTRTSELTAENKALAEVIGQLRRSLLDLNNQLESLRGELSKLRGSDEQILREVAEVQKRQRDSVVVLEDRIKKLEPIKVALDGSEFLAEPEEKRQYEEAVATMRGGDFDKAVAAFSSFLRRYPGGGYSPTAQFWLGNALYGKREYKDAISTFRGFVTGTPQHPRAPEAMLAVANSQVEMKDRPGARKTIDELMKTYPASEAAAAGKERLAAIK
jgi:tol-pal system protein YbgF